ncbi:MAG: hypothetical protein H7Y04_07700 [Verrucomicrobia bacterium]|nr:hypothetical protein [Cytophagales bacterium]
MKNTQTISFLLASILFISLFLSNVYGQSSTTTQPEADKLYKQIIATLKLTPAQQKQFKTVWATAGQSRYTASWQSLSVKLTNLIQAEKNGMQIKLLNENVASLSSAYKHLQDLASINPQPEPPGKN